MPLIRRSSYIPPIWAINGHLNTIYSAIFQKVDFEYSDVSILQVDGNEITIAKEFSGNSTLVICCHGLEGEIESAYLKRTVKYLKANNFDVLAWNMPGCGNGKNDLKYNSGKTSDLKALIDSFADEYDEVYLVGYSIGGNIVLKYLGEGDVNPKVHKAICFSVPCDLDTCGAEMNKFKNRIYRRRLMKSLNKKAWHKGYKTRFKTFRDFDEAVTAPSFGFCNAQDYYNKSSSIKFIKDIKTKTLLVNALDDSFLSKECYPYEECEASKYVYLETPKWGGHTGFYQSKGYNWSEERIIEFINE